MSLNFDTLTEWYDQPVDTLKEINAKKKELTLVEDISSCTKLRKLILSENSLTNNHLNLIGLEHITFLNLSHNNLDSLKGFEHLRDLNVLNVSHNVINNLPTDLPCYKNLKAFILNNNHLSKLGSLDSLVALNTLVLSHNKLKTIPSLDAMVDLAKLSAAHNNFKKMPDLSSHTTFLKEIRFNDNKITTIPDTLRPCQALEIIDLGNNQIEKWSDIAPLGSLLNLHNLNLHGNPITQKKDYKDKIMQLIPSLRVLDGERFDMKFLERKQKQATNLKLMEKKDRLKREKLEKKLESEYGLEAERKPRHKHLMRQEQPEQQELPDKKKKKKDDKRKLDQLDEDKKITKKKKKIDTFFDVQDMEQQTTVEEISSPVKPTPTTEPIVPSLSTDDTQPLKKRQIENILSNRERTGVLSMVDKSKKMKKKSNVEDVVATLEQMKEQEKEQSLTGLGADAWD
ncbi:uncharacterized protein BX664DRAFT_287359 [Halteromyces radiatus]|uniref:uncharacterized protein n=1 Tax=Halteromyces radiatus TaxID=101107 RepID=UPI00221EA57F|nr:uncharacterized protein BX664DRAFT_287359 [Halteromyces radiatus]KAI8077806.1 hypothetical protein BX664DRAFT_287359 [Halteromyces radiatus]